MARSGRGTLSGGKVAAYALGDVANNLSFLMTSMFLMVSLSAAMTPRRRVEDRHPLRGGSYSILSFIRKTGQGVGGAVGAAIIGAFGYVAKAPTQSAEALQGIRLATGAAPAALAVIAGLIIFAYPLTERCHRGLVGELTSVVPSR